MIMICWTTSVKNASHTNIHINTQIHKHTLCTFRLQMHTHTQTDSTHTVNVYVNLLNTFVKNDFFNKKKTQIQK